MDIRKFVKKISYNGQPKSDIEAFGTIGEGALGSIDLVKAQGHKEPLVLKAMDLPSQNVYCISKGLSAKKKTLRGSGRNCVEYLGESAKDCRLWAHLYKGRTIQPCKIAWLTTDMIKGRDNAKTILHCNEYINEAAVGRIVSKLPVPNVIRLHDAWIERGTGYLLMDYGGHSMSRAMVDYSLAEFQSIVLQTLCTVALAFEQCRLKHHDIHLDNVFVNRLRKGMMHNDKDLSSAKYWAYRIDAETTVFVPHMNLLAKIGDFGLASATDPESKVRIERIDYPLLDTGEIEWGTWNGTLENQESYDIVTFLTKFYMDEESEGIPEEHLRWLKSLYTELQRMDPNICASVIGRPLKDQEGTIKPTEFLKSSLFAAFRVQPAEEFVALNF
jgi:serine/threonine protein kinase